MTDKPKRKPTTFSEELGETLIKAVKENVSIVSLAATVGVSPRSLYDWVKRGLEGDERYQDFAIRFTAARQWLKNEQVENLRNAAAMTEKPHSVRAAETLLTKFYPQEFANIDYKQIHLEANIGGVDVSALSAHEKHQLLNAVKVARAIGEGAAPEEVKRLLSKGLTLGKPGRPKKADAEIIDAEVVDDET